MRRNPTALVVAAFVAYVALGGASAVAERSIPLATSSAQGPITLGTRPTQVRLVAPPDAPTGDASSLGARVRTLPADRPVYLRLIGLTANTAPGVTYNVYLNLPAGRAPGGTADPHYLGSFSFFDANPARGTAFNISKQLRQLDAAGKVGPDTTLTIVAAGEPSAGSAPQIGRIVVTAE
jgi:hypothetical protein